MVISDLAVLARAKGCTHWLYKTSLPLSFITLPGHCDNAAGTLQTGDLITIQAADGTVVRAVTVRREVRSVVQPWEVRLEELR